MKLRAQSNYKRRHFTQSLRGDPSPHTFFRSIIHRFDDTAFGLPCQAKNGSSFFGRSAAREVIGPMGAGIRRRDAGLETARNLGFIAYGCAP